MHELRQQMTSKITILSLTLNHMLADDVGEHRELKKLVMRNNRSIQMSYIKSDASDDRQDLP